MVAALMVLLAVTALVRAITALVEGLAVLLLVCILASLVLPGRLGAYWRMLRARIPAWLNALAGSLEQSSTRETATGTKEKEEGTS